MLTDRQNRPVLAFSLGVYCILMALMVSMSFAQPLGGMISMILFGLIWLLLAVAILGGMVWLADAPLIRRLHGKASNGWDAFAALLYLIGISITTSCAFAGVWSGSTLTYAAWFVLIGAAALHQSILVRRADRPCDMRAIPPARLVT